MYTTQTRLWTYCRQVQQVFYVWQYTIVHVHVHVHVYDK